MPVHHSSAGNQETASFECSLRETGIIEVTKAALSNTYNSVVKEINEIVTENSKHKKIKAQITANEIVPIWIYLVIFGEIENLLTEICIMQDFMLKDLSLINESGYHLINLITAVESFKNKQNDLTSSKITPSFINGAKYDVGSFLNDIKRRDSVMSTNSTRSESMKKN